MTRTLLSGVDLRRGRNRVLYYAALTLLMIVFSAVFFFPFYWMIIGALKDAQELALPQPTFIPQTWHPETYLVAWNELHIAKYFTNTAVIAVGGWLIQLAVDVTAAYALSKLRPVLGRVVLGAMLASLMLPASALLIPVYLTVVDVPVFHVSLLNTPWALWLPAAANAFNIYVLKRFFDQIPNELLDSASIDGAGPMRILWHIVLPISRPVLAVISIFAVIGMWKDFVFPLLVLQDPQTQTLSVALSRLASAGQVSLNEMMAGLVIASVPMVAFFLAFQRHILRGLAAGSIKG